jgi:hypothetical protein
MIEENINDIDNDYVIINNIDFFNFIYKFNSKGTVDSHIKDMVTNKNNYNYNEDESFISYFNMDEYVNDIKKSYNNKEENILEQFRRDYNRQNIRLNGYKYQENKSFLDEIEKILNMNKNLKSLIILLCCQSSFYLPYQILVNLYGINSENRALVCDSKNLLGIYIDVIIDDKKIIMELNNTLFIRDIDQNVNTHRINAKITIELELELELDYKIRNKSYCEPNICVFNWKIKNV